MHIADEEKIKLDLPIKGEKILYYRRKLNLIEKTVEIYLYCGNIWVWSFVVFCIESIYYHYLFHIGYLLLSGH